MHFDRQAEAESQISDLKKAIAEAEETAKKDEDKAKAAAAADMKAMGVCPRFPPLLATPPPP